MPEARRTLVKSPPELWAELSDPDALARHLGAFGEIRITRLDPESTVAWEGDRASGTVELSASGWGTKVRLTAEALALEEPALQQPLAAEEAAPAVEGPPAAAAEALPAGDEDQEPAPEPVLVAETPTAEPAAEPAAVTEDPAPAPLEAVEEQDSVADEPSEPRVADRPAKRRGFFARLFGLKELRVTTSDAESERRRTPAAPPVEEPEAGTAATEKPRAKSAAEEPVAPTPKVPEPEPIPLADSPSVAEPEPELASVAEAPGAPVAEPAPLAGAAPSAPADEAGLEAAEVEAVLTEALDTLGAAHHRPFSR